MPEKKKNPSDGFYDKSNKNYTILSEGDSIGWKTARKTKGMLGRILEKDVQIMTIEDPIQGKKGALFCIGAGGEYWVQKAENAEKKYNNKGKYPKPVTVDYMKDGKNKETYTDFIIFEPKPERAVLACQIRHKFIVEATWGKLTGKPGDFMVKPAEDALNPDPADVWIVDQGLFNATYEFT